MFEVIYMKAEFEPWWMFEGWEEKIVTRDSFEDIFEATLFLGKLLEGLHKENDNDAEKDACFYAFWSEKEKSFCDSCDEDLQMYHGVILLKDGKPLIIDKVYETDIIN